MIDGKIPRFKPEPEAHRRSALGITREGWILLAVADTPIGIGPWAELLQKEAVDVLNLDGGGSSQLSVQVGGFTLDLPGTTTVPNALAVVPKVNSE